mmetsp:Transcript_54527/g.137652  ORF Transcript_54527/g.137652 Transcript_54527/m.137652 type:complete len:212 (-) Transcript_54527:114-749(-)
MTANKLVSRMLDLVLLSARILLDVRFLDLGRWSLISLRDQMSPTNLADSLTSLGDTTRPQTRADPCFACMRSQFSKCLARAAARVTLGGPVTCRMHSAKAAPGSSVAVSVVLAHTSSATRPARPLGVFPANRCFGGQVLRFRFLLTWATVSAAPSCEEVGSPSSERPRPQPASRCNAASAAGTVANAATGVSSCFFGLSSSSAKSARPLRC